MATEPAPERGAGGVTLRAATGADAGAIADVYLASRRAFVACAPMVHGDDAVRAWIAGHLVPTGGVQVACEGTAVIGFSACSVDADGGWIDHLYLAPGSTGRGIGARLLDAALAGLPRPVRLYTFQANAGARRFYERAGFVAAEFGDGSGNEEGVADVRYVLPGPSVSSA